MTAFSLTKSWKINKQHSFEKPDTDQYKDCSLLGYDTILFGKGYQFWEEHIYRITWYQKRPLVKDNLVERGGMFPQTFENLCHIEFLWALPLLHTHIEWYWRMPSGPICWFCSRVFTRSRGNTHDTPMIPAMPPLIILGSNLHTRRNHWWDHMQHGKGDSRHIQYCGRTLTNQNIQVSGQTVDSHSVCHELPCLYGTWNAVIHYFSKIHFNIILL